MVPVTHSPPADPATAIEIPAVTKARLGLDAQRSWIVCNEANVFAWPGLGSTIVSSILQKDYPLVQGIVLVYGVGVLVVNTAVDVALALLDPRSAIREG